VLSILHFAGDRGYEPTIIRAAWNVNVAQIPRVMDKLKGEIGSFDKKTIGILGLSFKPNTDDLREAPSLKIIPKLIDAGARVKVFDPIAMDNAKKDYGGKIAFFNDSYSTVEGADALVIMTEWNEFRQLDLEKVKEILNAPIVIDCRNIYEPGVMREMGFRYHSYGRPDIDTG